MIRWLRSIGLLFRVDVALDELRIVRTPTGEPVTEIEHIPLSMRCLFCGHTLDVRAEMRGADVCSECAGEARGEGRR